MKACIFKINKLFFENRAVYEIICWITKNTHIHTQTLRIHEYRMYIDS